MSGNFSQTENDYLAISFADLRSHATIKKNYKRMKRISSHTLGILLYSSKAITATKT